MTDATLAGQIRRLRELRDRPSAPLILELDLTQGLTEGPPADPVSAVLSLRTPRLPDVLDGLRRARDDRRVRAVVAKVGGRRIGLATVQELRDAVAAVGAAGTLTVAWAETFGELGQGNLPYYLATAFDRIYLQPSGGLGLTGVAVQQWFFRAALDKIGVDFQASQRHEYKTAAHPLTERGFTGPAREANAHLATSIVGQFTDAIARRTGRTPRQARALVDRGPFLAADAHAERLVDRLGYRDEVQADVRAAAGPGAVAVPLGRYQRMRALAGRARRAPAPRERFVALVHACGPIRSGRSGRGPARGGMGSDTVGAAIRAAAADDRARAVVLRVNSPGGSYTASDTIWREVVRARAAGTPVVVSMGDVAASGGYYISMAADVIVAQPGTLTGSIGVLTGKPVLGELLRRVGVDTDAVTEGAHPLMLDPARPFSAEEWDRVNAWLDHIYADFTAKVAAGRRLSPEQVHDVARGRVWTGADAAANGLVDVLGGLAVAVDTARRRAGLRGDAPLRVFPRPNPLERLRAHEAGANPAAGLRALAVAARAAGAGGFGEPGGTVAEGPPAGGWHDAGFGSALSAASVLAESWGPVGHAAAALGLPAAGPLLLPGCWSIG